MPLRVKATERGYFGGRIREEGDEFTIDTKAQLGKWMEIAPGQEEETPPAAAGSAVPVINE